MFPLSKEVSHPVGQRVIEHPFQETFLEVSLECSILQRQQRIRHLMLHQPIQCLVYSNVPMRLLFLDPGIKGSLIEHQLLKALGHVQVGKSFHELDCTLAQGLLDFNAVLPSLQNLESCLVSVLGDDLVVSSTQE